MFSPYYAWARRHAGTGSTDPLNHCAVNVALYECASDQGSRAGSRWTMTERGRDRVRRTAHQLQIGPSALHWADGALHIELDEIAVPWPARLRGTVTLRAAQRFVHPVALAPGHHWHPIAPTARVEVELGRMRWSGPGYLDANHGDAPLESAFSRWDWSRAQLANGDAVVLYDVERLDASPLRLGLKFDARDGCVDTIDLPPRAPMPATRWRIERGARSDAGAPPRLLQTLTDAPFYARSLIEAQWLGERVTTMHESLSLVRFDRAWVQAMLPFRMPRLRR